MADLNKLRQNNPHWQPEDGDLEPLQSFIQDQEAAKQMAEGIKEMVDKHQEDLDKASAEGSTKYFPEEECPLDPVEEAKILIVDKITRHFQDIMFEMVNEEMSKCYLFQSQNYLTEAGYELFEDEYFEFYHTHHGDILYEVMKNITN